MFPPPRPGELNNRPPVYPHSGVKPAKARIAFSHCRELPYKFNRRSVSARQSLRLVYVRQHSTANSRVRKIVLFFHLQSLSKVYRVLSFFFSCIISILTFNFFSSQN